MREQILSWMGEYDVSMPEPAFKALCRLVSTPKLAEPLSKETRNQIAAVLLQTGTTSQQKQVLDHVANGDNLEFTALTVIDSAVLNIQDNIARLQDPGTAKEVASDLQVIVAQLERGKADVAYEMTWRAAVEDACMTCGGGATISHDPDETLSSLLTYHLLIENDPGVSQLARDAYRFRALTSMNAAEVCTLMQNVVECGAPYLEDTVDRKLELGSGTPIFASAKKAEFEGWFANTFPVPMTTNPRGEYVHFQVHACERTWFAAYVRGLQYALDAVVSGKLPELKKQLNSIHRHLEG